MIKKEKIQKKKTSLNLFLDILFKALVALSIIIFLFIAFTKVNFTTGTMDFNSKNEKGSVDTPSSLRWFDDFRGIENVPSKKQKEKPNKGNTGFNYQGFNK